MSFSRTQHLKLVMRGGNCDSTVRLTVGNDVEVLTCSRTTAHDLDRFIQSARLLHYLSHQLRHRFSIPTPLSASPHLANGDVLIVHGGDAARKPGIANVH